MGGADAAGVNLILHLMGRPRMRHTMRLCPDAPSAPVRYFEPAFSFPGGSSFPSAWSETFRPGRDELKP